MAFATDKSSVKSEIDFALIESDRKVLDVLSKPVTIDAFLEWYPENSEFLYELKRGVIIQMPMPRGRHSLISGKLGLRIGMLSLQEKLPYVIPMECVVKTIEDTGYKPDLIVLDETELLSESRWEPASTVENSKSIKLIVEIVSINWRDDYMTKFADYEEIGIQEYWIVDYAGLGGKRFIGMPKQPTLTICSLVDGEYELQLFRGDDAIVSPTFPNLILTANQIFNVD